MIEDIKEIKTDIKEIKNEVIHQKVHIATYNLLLQEHIKRTTLLETRVEPVEDHVKFVSKFLKFMGASGAVFFAQYLIRLFIQ